MGQDAIKRADQLPDWFDIRKYEALRGLDLLGWERQLRVRALLWCHLQDKGRDQVADWFGQWLRRLAADPIVSPGDDWRAVEGLPRPTDQASLRSLQVMDAYQHYRAFATDDLDPTHFQRLREACEAALLGEATPAQDTMATRAYDLALQDGGLSQEGLCTLVVDLSASDEQILADLRQWLGQVRRLTGYTAPAQNFTPHQFETWIAAGAIPYIDLHLWACWQGRSITQNALGEALFPAERAADTTERIRRTTRPKAEYLLREQTLSALSAQAEAWRLARQRPTEPRG